MSELVAALVVYGSILIPTYAIGALVRWRLNQLVEASSVVAAQLPEGKRSEQHAWHEAAILARHGRQIWAFAAFLYLGTLACLNGGGLWLWLLHLAVGGAPGAHTGF